ncbi:uncharacterized protein C1orf87 homolog [Sinocyclocheilus anshuiensis]|uniref:uncharacterized protein C1orf87 homolog n=1 Tax=Sinocyclocheilus anshuiensis TaxID=1608454 RepID=UPI0007B9FC69|nr:PREDICTED: uncharacterized protein C1orf87 homolog [Sinocyclocheilus anshuiensis]
MAQLRLYPWRPQRTLERTGCALICGYCCRPTDHLEVTNCSEDRHSPPIRVTDGDLSRKSPCHDLEHLRPVEHTENLLDALGQVPDRRCVTAPCGDRSRSYIHLKSTTNMGYSKRIMQNPHITEDQTEEPIKSSPEFCLLSSVSEELQDLEPQIFQIMEEEVTSLDPSRSGIIHQSELTGLFLRLKLPLKLTTLACMFRCFSNTTDPEQVHYQYLLQFIQKAVQDVKEQSVEAEIWDASVVSTDLESVSDRSDINAEQRETWLQRFQKMEMALQMCDTKNTGYVDREQAKRLIQNYSLIFDLNMSPLKVSEVTCNTQREGKVHLTSTLRQLKELYTSLPFT